jgi:uncharacterized lipoprotein YddW (UPF0748 family)
MPNSLHQGFNSWKIIFAFFVFQLNSCNLRKSSQDVENPNDPAKKVVSTGVIPIQLPEVSLQNLRGTWLAKTNQGHFDSQSKLKDVVSQLAKWNFNAIFPVVYTGGHTLYPSEFFRLHSGLLQDFNPLYRNRDVFAEVFQAANAQNMRVIPWFEYGFMVPVRTDLGKRKQYLFAKALDGRFSRFENGVEMAWLNILKPEVQDFIYSLISEFLNKYKVGAIQVDDHFGIPREFLTDAETVALYKSTTGSSAELKSDSDSQWNAFHEWKIQQVTLAVGKVFQRLKAQYPQLKISLSPNPLEFSKKNYHQDWKSWLDKGYIDNIAIQIYRYNKEGFSFELQSVLNSVPASRLLVGILAGITNKVQPVDLIQFQTQESWNKNAAGVIYFSYDALSQMPASKLNPGETAQSRSAFWSRLFLGK